MRDSANIAARESHSESRFQNPGEISEDMRERRTNGAAPVTQSHGIAALFRGIRDKSTTYKTNGGVRRLALASLSGRIPVNRVIFREIRVSAGRTGLHMRLESELGGQTPGMGDPNEVPPNREGIRERTGIDQGKEQGEGFDFANALRGSAKWPSDAPAARIKQPGTTTKSPSWPLSNFLSYICGRRPPFAARSS
jgi:hypothetical protein